MIWDNWKTFTKAKPRRKSNGQISHKDMMGRSSRVVVILLVFLAILAASLYSWKNLRSSVHKDFVSANKLQESAATTKIGQQLGSYSNTLLGGATLFQVSSNNVSQQEWVRYYQTYNLPREYPELVGIGYAPLVQQADLANYKSAAAFAGQPNIAISPSGNRPAYAPITFATDFKPGTNPIGYDLLKNQDFAKALYLARDNGTLALYPGVNLPALNVKSGFTIIVPVFTRGVMPTNVAERRADLQGFAFIGINSQVAFSHIITPPNKNFGVSITVSESIGGVTLPHKSLYESSNFATLEKVSGAQKSNESGELAGLKYEIRFVGSPPLLSQSERNAPLDELLRGIFTSLFFASLVGYLIGSRERRASQIQQQVIQSAKDDLLSLASHQLRTPATVVKQYVGMLLQGYAGKLTKEQKSMLAGAYESNERQLEIINQLLYVARLDAGQIKIQKISLDLNKMLQATIEAQDSTIKERKQKIKSDLPHKHISLPADANYLPMVFENLLTNASKYTDPGGSINLSARTSDDNVIIEITDDGMGIPESELVNIFNKFTRIKSATGSEITGSGIGLYLSKEIINLHGGTLDVDSKLGSGSTFRVCLPLQTPATNTGKSSGKKKGTKRK